MPATGRLGQAPQLAGIGTDVDVLGLARVGEDARACDAEQLFAAEGDRLEVPGAGGGCVNPGAIDAGLSGTRCEAYGDRLARFMGCGGSHVQARHRLIRRVTKFGAQIERRSPGLCHQRELRRRGGHQRPQELAPEFLVAIVFGGQTHLPPPGTAGGEYVAVSASEWLSDEQRYRSIVGNRVDKSNGSGLQIAGQLVVSDIRQLVPAVAIVCGRFCKLQHV